MAVNVGGSPSQPHNQKGRRRRRRKRFNSRALAILALLTFLVNGLFLWLAWSLFQEPNPAEPGGISDIFFSLPEPSGTPEPTASPTRVITGTPPSAQERPDGLSLSDISGGLLPRTPTPTAVRNLPPAVAPPAPPSPTPQPELRRAIIISIDGLRPDALFAAEAPHLDQLIARGTYCPTAQTVKVSITLPSHASMLTGMLPEKHGIQWNAPYIGWTGMTGPTLFNVAHDAGLSTAMIFGKEKMHYLVLPNSVDQLFGEEVHDEAVKARAVSVIQAGLPDVMFIHFPDVDRVGHSHGWMSPNQFEAIRFVDSLIGEIVAELERGGYLDSTLLIISADHGGHGFGHGDDSPEDRTIPWLAVGPGVPAGVTLNRPVNTYDTAPTVLYALDLPIPGTWDGRPVMEIFQAEQAALSSP